MSFNSIKAVIIGKYSILNKLLFMVICACFTCFQANAQEMTYWPFRNGALNLKTLPPSYIPSRTQVFYSNSAQCDSLGNLLFYSSGDTVWNKNNEVMDNGGYKLSSFQSGSGVIGETYSLKSSVSPNLYYIFFLPRIGINNTKYVLYKITIDINQNNGLGRVTSRDTLVRTLLTDLTLKKSLIDNSYWLFGYSFTTDSFYIYKFQQDSLLFINSYQLPFQYIPYSFGVTISHSNKFLLFYDTVNGIHKILRYDFNESNGSIVSQGMVLDSVGLPQRCLLSPNDSILYHATTNYIIQYNLFSKQRKQYSAFGLNNEFYSYFNALKYAPNGKLYYYSTFPYLSKNFVSEIRYPDKITDQHNFFIYRFDSISNQSTSTGFPMDEDPITRLEFDYFNSCNGIAFFNRSDTGVFKMFTWYFNDTDSFIQTIAHVNRWNSNPVLIYKNFPMKTGNYFVKIKGTKHSGYNLWGYDSVFYMAQPKAKFTTQSIQGCQYVAYQFNDSCFADTVSTEGYSYYWDYGDGTTEEVKNIHSRINVFKHTYNISGSYTVRLIFSNGFCIDTFSVINNVNILSAPKPGFTLKNKRGCTPFIFQIKDTLTSNITIKEYDFGNGFVSLSNLKSLDTTIQINKAGIYFIRQRLTGTTGCVTQHSDTLTITPGLSKSDTVSVLFTSVIDSNTTLTKWHSIPNAVFYSVKNIQTKDTFYRDNNVKPYLESYHYFIYAIDSCGNNSATSNVAQTIYLKGENENFNEFALLEYTPYETWKLGVMEYEVEYFNKFNQEWTTLNSVSGKTLSIKSKILPDSLRFNTTTSQVCYRIKAIEKNGNKQLSLSNVVCIPIYPVVFIPNAFSPNNDGINDYYKPFCTGLNSYIFEIYNRWGELVYTDTPQSNGWDGTFRGMKVESDTYFYRLSAIGLLNSPATNDARVVERKGTLFLVR